MWVEIALTAWTGIAFLWWILSLVVVSRKPLSPPTVKNLPEAASSFLSVFKPLPRLDDRANLEKTGRALRSFIGQLDPGSEMLIGIHEEEESKWLSFLNGCKQDFPNAVWKIILAPKDGGMENFPNPKVAWQHLLAGHARGDLWLWSDADITAPPHYLKEARQEYQSSAAGLLTHAYVVRGITSAPDLLNALFVNVEIYPGARLLGRNKEVKFGLGAGLLFSRKDFEEKIRWPEVGSMLADDFYLGTHLSPARLGSTILETYSGSSNLKESVLHYLRWQKTIRWCNPLGFAAQIAVLPILGWLFFALLSPFQPCAWAGFIATALAETLWVALLFRFTGCSPSPRFYGLVPVWSVFRVLAFLACWLPWPVIWRSQAWWGPVRNEPFD